MECILYSYTCPVQPDMCKKNSMAKGRTETYVLCVSYVQTLTKKNVLLSSTVISLTLPKS